MNKKRLKLITTAVFSLAGFVFSIPASSNPDSQSGSNQISEISGYKQWTKVNPELQLVLNPFTFQGMEIS